MKPKTYIYDGKKYQLTQEPYPSDDGETMRAVVTADHLDPNDIADMYWEAVGVDDEVGEPIAVMVNGVFI